MVFVRPDLKIAGLVLLFAGTPMLAQDSAETYHEEFRKSLPLYTEHTFNALEREMKRVHPEGQISLRGLDDYKRDRLSYERAFVLGRVMTLDRDFDGEISAAEWSSPDLALSPRIDDATPSDLLQDADTDGDGVRSAQEIRKAIRALAAGYTYAGRDLEAAERLRVIVEFDLDGDGIVDLAELRRAADELRKR